MMIHLVFTQPGKAFVWPHQNKLHSIIQTYTWLRVIPEAKAKVQTRNHFILCRKHHFALPCVYSIIADLCGQFGTCTPTCFWTYVCSSSHMWGCFSPCSQSAARAPQPNIIWAWHSSTLTRLLTACPFLQAHFRLGFCFLVLIKVKSAVGEQRSK